MLQFCWSKLCLYRQKGSCFRWWHLSQPNPTRCQPPKGQSPQSPRKSLRCVLPMLMRQMVEMELPFFYWVPWQSTAAGGACHPCHPMVGVVGRKSWDWLPFSGGLLEGNDEKGIYGYGADNDNADWYWDAVMWHAKHLLYDISICIIMYHMWIQHQWINYHNITTCKYVLWFSCYKLVKLHSLLQCAMMCGLLCLIRQAQCLQIHPVWWCRGETLRPRTGRLEGRGKGLHLLHPRRSDRYSTKDVNGISKGSQGLLCWCPKNFPFLKIPNMDTFYLFFGTLSYCWWTRSCTFYPMTCIHCFIHLNCRILLFQS